MEKGFGFVLSAVARGATNFGLAAWSTTFWATVLMTRSLPIVSLFRPYQVLRDVQEGLAPEDVEPPPLRLDPDLQRDYRSATFVVPPLPRSFLALWWGTFVAMSVVSRIANFATKGATSTVKSIVTAYRIEIVRERRGHRRDRPPDPRRAQPHGPARGTIPQDPTLDGRIAGRAADRHRGPRPLDRMVGPAKPQERTTLAAAQRTSARARGTRVLRLEAEGRSRGAPAPRS